MADLQNFGLLRCPSNVKLWPRVCGLINIDAHSGVDGKHPGFSIEAGIRTMDMWEDNHTVAYLAGETSLISPANASEFYVANLFMVAPHTI